MTDNPVILVSSTSDMGSSVRWFADMWHAERNQYILTVSVRGVKLYCAYLHEVPDEWISEAKEIYETLKENPYTDLNHLATHKHDVVPNGPLVPVQVS